MSAIAGYLQPILFAERVFGVRHLLHDPPADGIDYPMMPALTIAPAIAAFDIYAGFDDTARGAIRRVNAVELFPRFAP